MLASSMISLSDTQLQTVMMAAADLDPEKRPVFLERMAIATCGA
jgi:hypothetical protein